MILVAIFANLIAPYSYDIQNIDERLLTPNINHLAGTDALGRDLFSRIIYGARASMFVGIATALISLTLGLIIGSISGLLGGWIDQILMRITDIFYVIPSLLLAILVMVMMGQGILSIVIALATVGWVQQARLIRAQVFQIKELLHIEAAKAIGATPIRILKKHILPLTLGPLLVSLTYQIPYNVMSESFLSFLGVGIQPPLASWGSLASEGFRGMRSYPHLILFPGLILFFTMLAFQFLGDGLKDLLDKNRYAQRIE